MAARSDGQARGHLVASQTFGVSATIRFQRYNDGDAAAGLCILPSPLAVPNGTNVIRLLRLPPALTSSWSTTERLPLGLRGTNRSFRGPPRFVGLQAAGYGAGSNMMPAKLAPPAPSFRASPGIPMNWSLMKSPAEKPS